MHPVGEPGFCTEPCTDDDPDSCQPLGDSVTTCVNLGEPPAVLCALDCSSTPCPIGMVCESVEGHDGVRRICF